MLLLVHDLLSQILNILEKVQFVKYDQNLKTPLPIQGEAYHQSRCQMLFTILSAVVGLGCVIIFSYSFSDCSRS